MPDVPNYLLPRWQNPMTEFIETEYPPISPETRKLEERYVSEWGGMALLDHQVRIMNHIFTPIHVETKKPIAFEPGVGFTSPEAVLPYRTIVISCPKKSGKTGWGGAIGAAWSRVVGGEMYFIANGKEQARDRAFNRILYALRWMKENHPAKYERMVASEEEIDGNRAVKVSEIQFREPFARMEAIPCSAGGEAGGFQTFTLFDELWNYDSDGLAEFWAEMQPIDTVAQSIRCVVTYAGYWGKSSLLQGIYDSVVKPDPETEEPQGNKIPGLEDLPCYRSDDGSFFVYWDHERRMPWQTDAKGTAYIESARNDPSMRKSDFERLHRNRWVSSEESFIDINRIDALMREGTSKGLHNRLEEKDSKDKPLLFLGLEIVIKRDSTALVAVYKNKDWGAYCLWGHLVWTPTKDQEVEVSKVVDVIERLCRTQNVAGLFYDNHQFRSEAQRLRSKGLGRILHDVNQQGENVAFSNNLKGHIDTGDFLMYEDVTLKNHFKWCNVTVTERGWRIVKQKQSRPIDLVVSTAMALDGCAQSKDYQQSAFTESRHVRSVLAAA